MADSGYGDADVAFIGPGWEGEGEVGVFEGSAWGGDYEGGGLHGGRMSVLNVL